MALIICPKCGKAFSENASACPNCGISINEALLLIEQKKEEQRLAKERKAAIRRQIRIKLIKKVFLGILGIAIAIVVGIGIFEIYKSSKATLVIPEGVETINRSQYNGKYVKEVIIPNSVTSIEDRAFDGWESLTSVTIPDSVTSIGNYTFEDCSRLTSIIIPNSVTSIGNGAFWGCTSLTSIVIPNSVTSIGERAFHDCSSLTSITIPNSVKRIGHYAFEDCGSLTSVTIPNSVTSIENGALHDCRNLRTIYNYAEIPQNIDSHVFSGVDKSTCTLYVPANSIELYQRAEGWRDFIIKPISD